MKPKILLVATSRWIPTARLAMVLVQTGFEVEAVTPRRHPLEKTGVVRRMRRYRGLIAPSSIKNAIDEARPDLIVPCDDTATQHLHRLYENEKGRGQGNNALCELIERSLGCPESFPVLYQRTSFMQLAKLDRIRIPDTRVVKNLANVSECIVDFGLPIVLKVDGTTGGEGVCVAENAHDAERAFRILDRPPLLTRAAKRAFVDQDTTLVWPAVLRRKSVVNAQAFISGHEATSVVACWKGEVLAALHFEVLKKRSSAGPATVLCLLENGEMAVAVSKVVRRLNLSGIHGFDFMLENGTGAAYLIEINPRTTQVAHLTLGPRRDIPAALFAVLSGNSVQPAPRLTEKNTFALFPHEWLRDCQSEFLRSAYHDVPWEVPALVSACLRAPRAQLGWRAYQRFLPLHLHTSSPRVIAVQGKPVTAVSRSAAADAD
ncbi:MAG: ATP-grasp domain-containing protein [Acidobacteria bacterium]|nr:ATP-grasp domain-containing protein [Acidobacteriota bacterium]